MPYVKSNFIKFMFPVRDGVNKTFWFRQEFKECFYFCQCSMGLSGAHYLHLSGSDLQAVLSSLSAPFQLSLNFILASQAETKT